MDDDASSMWMPHRWNADTRDPLFEFSIPGNNDEQQRYYYGFYFMSIPMWIGLVVFIVSCAVAAATYSTLLYVTVVQRPNTWTAYLCGWCLHLPFWILTPRLVMQVLQVQNKLFLFCCCVITPTTALFRITEAMYGFTPKYAAQSMSRFALYFGSPMIMIWDEKSQKHVKASWQRVGWHVQRFVGLVFVAGFYQSLFKLFPAIFPPLGGPLDEERLQLLSTTTWYAWGYQIVNPVMWMRTLAYAGLFQVYLSAYGEGLMMITTLFTGRQVHQLMDNPLLESTSPSEFWGRRWNSLVHECLKNGVYKPVRVVLGGSKELAVMASFVASGLFHEWILPVVFPELWQRQQLPPFGTTSLFFVWQALLIALEYYLSSLIKKSKSSSSSSSLISRMASLWQGLPTPIKTAMVVMAGAPLGHWFVETYAHSTFFEHGHITLFAILPIASTG